MKSTIVWLYFQFQIVAGKNFHHQKLLPNYMLTVSSVCQRGQLLWIFLTLLYGCFSINNFQSWLHGGLVIISLYLFYLCQYFNYIPPPYSPLFLWCQMSHLWCHKPFSTNSHNITPRFFGNKIMLFVFSSSCSHSMPGCRSIQTMPIWKIY